VANQAAPHGHKVSSTLVPLSRYGDGRREAGTEWNKLKASRLERGKLHTPRAALGAIAHSLLAICLWRDPSDRLWPWEQLRRAPQGYKKRSILGVASGKTSPMAPLSDDDESTSARDCAP
jgi:hypothetical protein